MSDRPPLIVAGDNFRGACFLPDAGGTIDVPTPASLEWLAKGRLVVRMTAGLWLTVLLDDKACVHAVGSNYVGQLGRGHNNDDDPDNHIPRPVPGFGQHRIVQIAAGWDHCAAVAESGLMFLGGAMTTGSAARARLAATCSSPRAALSARSRMRMCAWRSSRVASITRWL